MIFLKCNVRLGSKRLGNTALDALLVSVVTDLACFNIGIYWIDLTEYVFSPKL